MTNFLIMPSVALLLHSCYILCSVFKVQFPTFTLDGGDNRDRTDDPLLAKQVLSQLSYTPVVLGSFVLKVRNEPQKLNNDF